MIHDQSLRDRLYRNLSAHPRISGQARELRPAAVAVAVIDDDRRRACYLLTRRAPTLRTHSGQWALPGGRVDAGESAVEAACRELDEELAVREVEVLGVLDDYATRSGYRITPVVLWVAAGAAVAPSPAEVAEVYRVPLTELERDDAPQLVEIEESDRPVLRMPLGDRWINAPTGAVLYQFREVALHGRTTRVAHYEQPRFAWK